MDPALRFVVQEHRRQNEPPHWDLMLERAGDLETYRLALPPEKLTSGTVVAEKIFDHPLRFLTYEGPVNYGAGSVKIADSGTYEAVKGTEQTRILSFKGKILKTDFVLRHIEAAQYSLGPRDRT
jgi:hypothetical protein